MYDYLVVGSGLYGAIFAHEAKAHGKSVLVDREVAFVGSVNMDYRSFQLHFECGTVLYGAPCLEELLEDMDHIMARSRRLSYAEWQRRPWLHRVLGPVMKLFAMWM